MNVLKKRSVAIIIVIIIAVVFTFVGIRISVKRQAEKVEAMFYSGVDGETAVQTSLDNIFKEAKVIYSTAEEYLGSEIPKPFRIAYNNMYDADTISEKYDCYQKLMAELEVLHPYMEEGVDNSYDKIYYATHKENLENIGLMLDGNSYNEKVQDYEENILNRFPVSLVKGILDLEAPEYFS